MEGAREGGGGARPRAPGPRSRCGQAPGPPRGPGYSPRRCSSATSPPTQRPPPPAPHTPRSHRPLGRGRLRRPRRRRRCRGARPLSRTPPWPRTRLSALASLSNRTSAAGRAGCQGFGPRGRLRRVWRLFPARPTRCPPQPGSPGCGCPAGTWLRVSHVTVRHYMASRISSLPMGQSPP